MSHHGECDIDPKRTKQTSGSQQPGSRAHDLGPGSRVDGQYEPIHIEELAEDTLQGYSGVLNLNIRWEGVQLRWYDPTTDQHIVTFDDERARADRAEAQVQELEAELQRLREA